MINQFPFLSKYKTLTDLQKAQDWSLIKIRDRLTIIAWYKNQSQLISAPNPTVLQEKEPSILENRVKDTFSLSVELNESQQRAVQLAREGKSFVLTGAAGSGKTTTEREIVSTLLKAGYKASQIAIGAFTRVATGNSKKAIEKDPELESIMKGRIQTLHAHLEFKPVWWQDAEGKWHMRFVETRHEGNPMTCRILIIDEAPMVDLLLYEKLFRAMLPGVIVIFIGDINQLPPVFGKSIFNYALHQLPVVELTKVYRQADDSGILTNAWRILDGEVPEENKDTEIIWFKKNFHISQRRAALALGRDTGFFHKRYKDGKYDPEQDIIISPWGKQEMGTNAMNDWIAQWLGDERKAIVHQIIAGRRKLHLAVGDLVYCNKQLGHIVEIAHNGGYIGKAPLAASHDLLRCGMYRMTADGHDFEEDDSFVGYGAINVDQEISDEERKNQASHIVKVRLKDSMLEEGLADLELTSAGDFGDQVFSLGYCITGHKSQGSEWRQVFIILHPDHTTKGAFVSNEWLYTTTTRAREKLVYISRPDILEKGVKNRVIKGKTLEEKIAFINSGAQDIGAYPVIKEGEFPADVNEDEPEIKDEKVKKPISLTIKEEKQKIRFTDFAQFVPDEIKNKVIAGINKHWAKALSIYGDSLKECPEVTFDCQKASIVALVNPQEQTIKFNPVFLIAGTQDAQDYITEEITAHEVAHIVTARYVSQTGHGKDWQMTMKLLGKQPQQFYSGPALPDWKTACLHILGKTDTEVDIIEGELTEGDEE